MRAFLEDMEEKYGDVAAYVKQFFGCQDGDLEKIRGHLQTDNA